MAVGVMQPSGKFRCAFVRSGRLKVKRKSRISRGSWTWRYQDDMPRLLKPTAKSIVAYGFLAQHRRFGEILRFNAFGDFLLVIEFEAQFALLLVSAPDGLNSVEVRLSDTTMIALKARERLVEVHPQQGKSGQQKTDERHCPNQPRALAIKRPEQARFCVRIRGGL